MSRAAGRHPEPWQLWIDTGGTFTDCVAVDPWGSVHRAKVLSSGAVRGRVGSLSGPERLVVDGLGGLPAGLLTGRRARPAGGAPGTVRVVAFDAERGELLLDGAPDPPLVAGCGIEIEGGEEAPVLAARIVTGTSPGEPFPALAVRLATTRGTNALLERKGASTALFITRGFGDLLEIGNQQRPDLFALAVRKQAPLHAAVAEVEERLDAAGEVLVELDLAPLEGPVRRLLEAGTRSAAVALLHSYRNPDHERRLRRYLMAAGFEHVACSTDLVPLIKLLPRAETAVVDAYLAPVIGDYLEAVESELGAATLHVMTSAGGLVRARDYRPKDSLLSGPAGGVVGAAVAAARSHRVRVIAFDMGGTSTDVSRFDGDYEYRFETRVGPARLMAPTLAIETVAAGGGSICHYDGHRLRVGPGSAGADPGPACYGAGGPLCLTDVNLLLGRLAPERFGIPIHREAAAEAAERLFARLPGEAAGRREALLEGLLRIADERMAEAVRQISVRRGYDPAEYSLVAFGGAGPQHACALAGLLDIPEILIPADASLLSAHGLGGARIERFAARQVLAPLAHVGHEIGGWLDELAEQAVAEVEAEGVARDAIEVRLRRVELRLAGQDTSLPVEHAAGRQLSDDFALAYRRIYGYSPPERPVEVVSLRVVASSRASAREEGLEGATVEQQATGGARTRAWFGGGWLEAPLLARSALGAGRRIAGPALVVEAHTATVVEPGWDASVDEIGALVIRRRGGPGV